MIDIPIVEHNNIVNPCVTHRIEIHKEVQKEVHSIDAMFTNADTSGKFRLASINSAKKFTSVLAGSFGFQSAKYSGFWTNMSANFSQKITSLSAEEESLSQDLLAQNKDSFAYIALSSINYSSEKFEVKAGRILVDYPFADSDDIRVAPNSFEGISTTLNYNSKLKSNLLYFTKWAGYDSQDEAGEKFQNKFKDLVDSKSFGMVGASLEYAYNDETSLSLWYDYVDAMSAIAYIELNGVYEYSKTFNVAYALQGANFQEVKNSGTQGSVLGSSIILTYKELFSAFAYNKAYSKSGHSISNGFGGGPYFTSMEEANLAGLCEQSAEDSKMKASNDSEAYRISLGYDVEDGYFNGLGIEVAYAKVSNSSANIKEKDIIITHELSSKFNLEISYADYDSSYSGDDFARTFLRVDYDF